MSSLLAVLLDRTSATLRPLLSIPMSLVRATVNVICSSWTSMP